MIESVKVTNYLNESITLTLRHPELSGLAVRSITGLGPPKANINITEITTNDGGIYNSSRTESRNIVMSLIFMDFPTIEASRHLTYKYFPIKKPVTISVKTDTRTAKIEGYVESNEPTIFSEREGCQISIICPDSYFYEPSEEKEVFSNIEFLFEFPFENDSLTDNLIEFGNIELISEQVLVYDGDADTGVIIEVNALGTASNIVISNSTRNQTLTINTDKIAALTGSGIIARDTIIINTNKGKKSIKLLRNGEYTNILNCLDKNAEWFQLAKGDNVFVFSAETGIEKLEFRIKNNILYEGV